MKYYFCYETPVGPITIGADDEAITDLHFGMNEGDQLWETELIKTAHEELQAYFNGKLRTFDLPIKYSGTPFQRAVWEALMRIPFGETRSYAETAWMAGSLRGARAVGMAVHNNPAAIIIPCHRVIYAGGKIGGFGSDIGIKRKLLSIEGAKIKD
ncbi:MAG: methylated-DNA--[protein]-cysteine S-methyltransferase [Oscillospiraceae bacterium]